MKLFARKSYTLIEVLIVMFIIAGLTGLLLPALQSAKGKARQAQCMNNLHQLHLGLELYAEDNNSAYPVTGNVAHWGDGTGWCEQIYKYTRGQTVYKCNGQPQELQNDYSYFLNSYSAFTNSNGTSTFFTRDHIKIPSQFILAGDSTYTFGDLTDTDKDNKTQDCLFTWAKQRVLAKRYHGSQVCVLFADGHLVVSDRFRPDLMSYSFSEPGVDFALPDPAP
jgi:prepilin-type processing-associated H-X9-DG protein